MTILTSAELKNRAANVRRTVLEMCVAAGAGHIAPAYSCTELLVALYHAGILRVDPKDPHWPDRDRFVLSKGQACAALYAILADLGFFPVEELLTYTARGSRLGGHSESNVPGVEAFTGSLGNGFALAVGMALAAKLDGRKHKVVALLGDGECQEGAIWEAAMFSSQHKLGRLIAVVDRNGQQAIDFTEEAVGLEPFAEKWRAFGWEVVEIADGHDFDLLVPALTTLQGRRDSRPLVFIARTVKGKGLSFMERKPIWHYRVPTGPLLDQAREELSR